MPPLAAIEKQHSNADPSKKGAHNENSGTCQTERRREGKRRAWDDNKEMRREQKEGGLGQRGIKADTFVYMFTYTPCSSMRPTFR